MNTLPNSSTGLFYSLAYKKGIVYRVEFQEGISLLEYNRQKVNEENTLALYE